MLTFLLINVGEVGQPYYTKWHSFKPGLPVVIPDRYAASKVNAMVRLLISAVIRRPAYGTFRYLSMVRQPQSV